MRILGAVFEVILVSELDEEEDTDVVSPLFLLQTAANDFDVDKDDEDGARDLIGT